MFPYLLHDGVVCARRFLCRVGGFLFLIRVGIATVYRMLSSVYAMDFCLVGALLVVHQSPNVPRFSIRESDD